MVGVMRLQNISSLPWLLVPRRGWRLGTQLDLRLREEKVERGEIFLLLKCH